MIYYKLAAIFRSGYFFQWDWVSLHSCAMNNTKSGDKVWATAYISECLKWNDKQVHTCAIVHLPEKACYMGSVLSLITLSWWM